MAKPLFIKFRTGDCFYLLDSETNEILRTNQIIFDIADDVDFLDDDVVLQKYASRFSAEKIDEAISVTRNFFQKNASYKRDILHPKVKGVVVDKKGFSYRNFLDSHSRLLTLELTQKCNLNCKYCTFGDYYTRYRSHGTGVMTADIAERAIRQHLDKTYSGETITFYGGEPLLEFDLLKHLAVYAENYCAHKGKQRPAFSITTNGTLLSDKIIKFLVEHEFNVLVSVDGDRETHDQYRIFRESNKGSFETVHKNLHRFIELYPDYQKRGLSVTLTTSSNFLKTNLFLQEFVPFFPSQIVNFANLSLGIGDRFSSADCEQNSCAKYPEQNGALQYPDFLIWTPIKQNEWNDCREKFFASLKSSWTRAKDDWPLFFFNFFYQMKKIHDRDIKVARSERVACCCIPGAVRLFCDIHGNYFPCERVETNDALKIGDVWTGIDADRSLELINFMSDVTSCGSCAGKHLCGICPSSIAKSDAEDRKDLLIQKHCEVFVDGIKDRLVEYAWLMENGIVNFDKFIEQEPARKDWLSDVKFVVEKVE